MANLTKQDLIDISNFLISAGDNLDVVQEICRKAVAEGPSPKEVEATVALLSQVVNTYAPALRDGLKNLRPLLEDVKGAMILQAQLQAAADKAYISEVSLGGAVNMAQAVTLCAGRRSARKNQG